MSAVIEKKVLARAAAALMAQARDIAGHSQAPHLISPEETQEWADAQVLLTALSAVPRVKRIKLSVDV
jgi:hypothetical protein